MKARKEGKNRFEYKHREKYTEIACKEAAIVRGKHFI